MKTMNMHATALDYLSGIRLFNGSIPANVMAKLPLPEGVPNKAKIVVRPIAYLKMVRLIMDFSTEVGWHGLCHRDENDPATFIIEDVMVYPQQVTGTTIKTDEARHLEWYDSFPDEQFNQIRFHGHSHVNMGVFSSGTDDDLQRDLVGMLRQPEDFYLFFIMNKRLETFVRLYDNKYGVMFETSDTEIYITDGENDIIRFLNDSKEQVKAVAYNYGKGATAGKTTATTTPPTTGVPPITTPAASAAKNATVPAKENKAPHGGYGYDYDDTPLGYWEHGDWIACSGKGVYA